MKPIITLTTDWGVRDYFGASVKGAILSQCRDAIIVDISHMVAPFDILQASFILRNSYTTFPTASIHIIDINTQIAQGSPALLVHANGHFFIGRDNGIFSMILDQPAECIIELNIPEEESTSTFFARDIYVRAACHLAMGGRMDELGVPRDKFFERTSLRPVVDNSLIRANVIYIDRYENIVTNVTKELFEQIGKGRAFTIFFRQFDYNIDAISTFYNDVPEGEKLALFSASNLLEIAINGSKASSLLGLKINDSIRIEFYDNADR